MIKVLLLLILYSVNSSFTQQCSLDFINPQQVSLSPTNINFLATKNSLREKNKWNAREYPDSNYRNAYVYLTIGLAEILGFGLGYQINKNYALGIKYGGCWIAKGFRYGAGLGLKLSRTLNYKVFNNINLETTVYLSNSGHPNDENLIKGTAIELNIGNESKLAGINFIWSFGIITSISRGDPPLFVPNIKIGFNINF